MVRFVDRNELQAIGLRTGYLVEPLGRQSIYPISGFLAVTSSVIKSSSGLIRQFACYLLRDTLLINRSKSCILLQLLRQSRSTGLLNNVIKSVTVKLAANANLFPQSNNRFFDQAGFYFVTKILSVLELAIKNTITSKSNSISAN